MKFSTLLVIESLRSNSKIYNFVLYDNSNNTISYGPNYTPLMLSGRQQQQQQSFYLYCFDIRRGWKALQYTNDKIDK